MKRTLAIALAAVAGAAIAVTNQSPTNVTTTSAWARVSVSAGTPVLTLHYGASDAGTNLTWAATNAAVTGAVGTVSAQITGLTKASRYYYRWRNQSTTNWAAGGTVTYYTLADSPTGLPSPSAVAVMVNPDTAALIAPTNFWTANSTNISAAAIVETDPLSVHTNDAAYLAAMTNATISEGTANSVSASGRILAITVKTNYGDASAITNLLNGGTAGLLGTITGTGKQRTITFPAPAATTSLNWTAVSNRANVTELGSNIDLASSEVTGYLPAKNIATNAPASAPGYLYTEDGTNVYLTTGPDVGSALTGGYANATIGDEGDVQVDGLSLAVTFPAPGLKTNSAEILAIVAATGALNTAVGSLNTASNAHQVRIAAVESGTNALDTRVGTLEAGGTAAKWSQYPATQNVNFAGYSISNVLEITGIENGVPVLSETFDTDPFAGRWDNAGMTYNAPSESIFTATDGATTSLTETIVIGRQYRLVYEADIVDIPVSTGTLVAAFGGVAFTNVGGGAGMSITNEATAVSTDRVSLVASIVGEAQSVSIYSVALTDITPSNSVAIPRLNVTGRLDGLLGTATNAIAGLQTATNALDTLARAALPKAGGTMAGNIDMGGASVTNIGSVQVTNVVDLPPGGMVRFGVTNYVVDQITNMGFKIGTNDLIVFGI